MPRIKSGLDELDMVTAAYLAGEGWKQTEIAKTLRTNQAAVSRLLVLARKRYLREEVRFLQETVSPETMQKVMQRVSRNKLSEKLKDLAVRAGHRGPVLRVFHCDAPVSERWQRMGELSRQAAPYIRDLILRSKVCGVTWGGMLSQVVSAVQDLSMAPPWKEDKIEIIPLGGEPLGDGPTTYSSSSLAHELGAAVNGPEYYARSLAMVPAFIPDDFEEDEIRGVWRLIGLVPAYKQIFGTRKLGERDQQAMANDLDMVLTSVGPAHRLFGFGRGRLIATGNLKLEDLQKLAIGDMGGVCFERAGLTKRQRVKLEGVAARWTGWSRRDLDRCVARANAVDPFQGPPGIAVISIGKDRAEFLLEAVALGRVNHLLIDDELQVEMERLLATRPAGVEESSGKQMAGAAGLEPVTSRG
jgi:DNA-binding transcriptional regulator LsrR (DeoR family)